MTRLIIFALALLAVSCTARAPGNRIVGGKPTTIDKYPDMVQIDFRQFFSNTWSQSCAGVIINPRHVLSAAHCFAGLLYRPELRRFRAGTTFRNTGGSLYEVDQVFNHESYGLLANDGDITVIRTSTAIEYNDIVKPAQIVSQGFQLPDNLPVIHAGWGATSQGGSASNVLLDVTIYTVNNTACTRRYYEHPNRFVVTSNMICAGILGTGGADACQGDSGGPMYYNGVVVGVVSWGFGCADPNYPGVSTAVSSYSDWVQSIANN
ncbi:hypothetical protein ACJJTC_016941 [Scirpophaga incertulas]